jgi:hypothetical protein
MDGHGNRQRRAGLPRLDIGQPAVIVKIDFPLPVKSIAIRVRALAVIRGISDNAQINEIERTLIEMERERRMMDQALREVEA